MRGADDWPDREKRDPRLARLSGIPFSAELRQVENRLQHVWERELQDYPGVPMSVYDGEQTVKLSHFVELMKAFFLVHGHEFRKAQELKLKEA